MRTAISSFGCIILASALAACGKDPSVTIESLLPAENAVTGWVFDPAYPLQPVIKTSSALTEGYPEPGKTGGINGSGTPLIDHNFTSFVARYYVNGNYQITVWLSQFPDAATAKSLYDDFINPGPSPRYPEDERTKQRWTPTSVGDAGSLAFTGARAVLIGRKNLFYWELYLKTKDASDLPETTKQMVVDFGKAIASNVK